jgi:glycosyltransferase involved in cell wall biosynthesis
MQLTTLRDTLRGYGVLARYESRAIRGALAARSDALLKRRRVLLIAPFLPPYDNGGVARPLSWLQYARANGWDMAVVTRPFVGEQSPSGRYLAERMPGEVQIGLMQELDLRPSWSLFPRTDGTFLGALGAVRSGDALIRAHGATAVVATGPSFDAFVAAFYLSRMHGLPLVLDYRDEWTQNPFSIVQPGNADRFWERRCLAAAALVIFTTERMRAHQHSVFAGLLAGKSAVLHNGWEPLDNTSEQPGDAAVPNGASLRVFFAGTLGHATLPGDFLADVASVLAASRELREALSIEFIGTRVDAADTQIRAFPYADNVRVGGSHPRNVANAMIRASGALLLLAPDGMQRYIPAKLFEYLASGKPILVHGVEGEASDIVTRLGAGAFVHRGDVQQLRCALDDFRTRPSASWDRPDRRDWVRAHTREALAATFFAKLDALASVAGVSNRVQELPRPWSGGVDG